MRARLEEKVQSAADAVFGGAPRCSECGRAMKSRGRRCASFLSRFGEVTVRGSRWRCRRCPAQHASVLQLLGAEAGRTSGSLARLLALLGVVVPYELAARLAYVFFGVEVNAMTVWRAVQRLGRACEQYVEEQARFCRDPQGAPTGRGPGPAAVLLGVDGSMLGMQVHPHRRRNDGDRPLPPLPAVEDGHFREVKTGVLLLPAERVEPTPGRRSVVRRALVTCLGEADAVFDRLWAKLHELGWLGEQTVAVIIGDGAEWIWNRASMFPRRCEILDFWHAVEKAWEFARLRWGEESKRAASWAHRLADDLRGGRVTEVIARLEALPARTGEEGELLEGLIRYYTENRSRMHYDEYLRKGYGIGSGAVESAHKQVVQARMRQAGMRWSEAGAQRLLALRVLLLNDQWSMLDRLTMKPLAA
ncbi:MAG: ISKra4 family transposase [Candidatus Rokuibacteriota bacterium]